MGKRHRESFIILVGWYGWNRKINSVIMFLPRPAMNKYRRKADVILVPEL